MDDQKYYDELITTYYQSRPNLQQSHAPTSIFFLACSGAGKSTLRKVLVERLGATYVCNDEVRELVDKYPDITDQGSTLKAIISGTWRRILADAQNKMVVFDNNIINYYHHDDSFTNVSKQLNIPTIMINLDVPQQILRQRIVDRGFDVEWLLSKLPTQIEDYKRAVRDIEPHWKFTEIPTDEQLEQLVHALEQN